MQYKIQIQFKYVFGSGQGVPEQWKSFIPLHGLFPKTNFPQWMPSMKVFMTRICVWPLIKLISLTRLRGKLVDAQLIKKVHVYENQWQNSVLDKMNPFQFITLFFGKIYFNIRLPYCFLPLEFRLQYCMHSLANHRFVDSVTVLICNEKIQLVKLGNFLHYFVTSFLRSKYFSCRCLQVPLCGEIFVKWQNLKWTVHHILSLHGRIPPVLTHMQQMKYYLSTILYNI